MWSSVTAELVDRLVPDGGRGFLGQARYCRECEVRGYTRKVRALAGSPQLLCGKLRDYQRGRATCSKCGLRTSPISSHSQQLPQELLRSPASHEPVAAKYSTRLKNFNLLIPLWLQFRCPVWLGR